MALDPVLYRTPMFDPKTGGMSREWVRFFDQFSAAIKLLEITPADLAVAGPGGIENVLSTPHGGTGQSSYTNGQILVGRTADNSLVKALLTASDTNVAITNGPGAIAIGAPNVARKDLSNTFVPAQTFSSSVHAQSLVLDNALPVAQGGTGANNAASALAALGGASLSLSNTFGASQTISGTLNVTDLNPTNALPIPKGGTGATTAAAALAALGGASLSLSNTFTASQNISAASSISLTVTGNLNTGFGGVSMLADGTPVLNARTYGSTATTILGGITLTNWSVIYHNSGNGLLIETANATPLVLGTNNAERARFVSAGRLLIGTTTDDGTNLVQVNGGLATNNLTVNTPANVTLGSGWINWTPTVTGFASMTVSGLTLTDAQYLRFGPMVYFKLWMSLTLGGTASNQIFATVPVNIAGNLSGFFCAITQGGGARSGGWGYIDPSGQLMKIILDGEVNFTLGAATVLMEGFYRCV